MPGTSRLPLRSVVVAPVAALALFAPPAAAAEDARVSVSTTEAQVAKGLDPTTRAIAQNAPEAVAAAATACGSGYTLSKGIPLPLGTEPSQRLATLFAYENGGKGCAILDNNAGSAQYMYLKVCRVSGANCDSDSGTFSEYAGPVYVSSFACAPVTAKMGQSSSRLYINYSSEYVFPCG